MHSNIYISFWKISLIFLGIFFIFDTSYAASLSGKLFDNTWSNILPISSETGSNSKNDKNENETKWEFYSGSTSIENSKTIEESEEEQKLKQDINTYIIESYKAQWSRIIKDLSIKLAKSIPDKTDRQEAYRKIRMSLETRLEKTGKLKMSETKKLILKEFLSHTIDLLDKKIDELN